MSDTTLARRNGAGLDLIPAGPVPLRSLQEVIQLGELLAKTGYFKDVRDAGQAVAKMLYGMELGIGPMGSMMGVHIIEGKPSPSANLMATLIKRSGRYNYRVTTWTDQECVIDFFEHGQPCGTASFTLAEAQRANVAGKDVWRKYPKAMLFSRAISQGARAFCADVFGGAPVYTAEELGAAVDVTPEGDVVPQAASPATVTPAGEPVNAATGEIAGEAHEVPADDQAAAAAEWEAITSAARPAPPAMATADQATVINDLFRQLRWTRDGRIGYLRGHYQIERIGELTEMQAADVIADLSGRVAA